jgi:hypothetical protein
MDAGAADSAMATVDAGGPPVGDPCVIAQDCPDPDNEDCVNMVCLLRCSTSLVCGTLMCSARGYCE